MLNYEGYYVCECGREFTNSQAFNGHKSSCKIHRLIKDGSLDKMHEERHLQNTKSAQTRSILAAKSKQEELDKWLSEQHRCKHCGNIMTEKFGSGVYCSRACANAREVSQKTKDKISNSLKGTSAYVNTITGKVSYFKQDQEIPDNFAKTGPKKKKLTAIINPYRKIIVDDKLTNVNNQQLLELSRNYIDNHNKEVLSKYENFLKGKSINKEFAVEGQFILSKYYAVKCDHHLREHNGDVFVHILLAEKLLDRPLTKSEIVHHKNRDKLDNRFDNIYIFNNKGSHARFHYGKFYWLTMDNDVLICDKVDLDKLEKHFSK